MRVNVEPSTGKRGMLLWRVFRILAVVIILSAAIYYVYDHNGGFDTDTDLKIVISGSMDGEPRDEYRIESIPTGSLVWIKRTPTDPVEAAEFYSSLSVGDVLTFDYTHPISKKNMVVTHRIISISGGPGNYTYELQGDRIADDPLNGSVQTVTSMSGDIIGKVSGVSPWIGQAVIFLSTIQGKLCLIGIPCAILIAVELNSIRKNISSLRGANPHDL